MDKKGQFYLITALILLIPTYTLLVSQQNFGREKTTNFDVLSKNYISESRIVINNALYYDNNIYQEIESFTQDFIDYSNTKNIDLKILYMVKNGESLRVVNYLKDVEITDFNITLKSSETINLNTTNEITIKYEETEYIYEFSNETIEFKALIMS